MENSKNKKVKKKTNSKPKIEKNDEVIEEIEDELLNIDPNTDKKKKEELKKNSKKKLIRNAFIFAFLIILTYYFIFKKMDRKGIQEAIKQTNLWFILIAIIMAAGNILFEALNHYRTLNSLGEKVSPRQAIKYAVVGFFFSAITPARPSAIIPNIPELQPPLEPPAP